MLSVIIKIKDSEFKIRKCEEGDYWFAYKLLKSNMYSFFVEYWGGWNPKVFRKDFNKENIQIVEYKGKRVAFYDIEFKKNFSYINNVQVSTLMRSKGLGTRLIELMEKQTKKRKLGKIRLRAFKDNRAKQLYLKLGYKQVKDEGSAVILEKKL